MDAVDALHTWMTAVPLPEVHDKIAELAHAAADLATQADAAEDVRERDAAMEERGLVLRLANLLTTRAAAMRSRMH